VTTELYLIRHGEAVANIEPIIGGMRGDAGLTDRGREQARLLEQRLRAEQLRADQLYASTLRPMSSPAGCWHRVGRRLRDSPARGRRGAVVDRRGLPARDATAATRAVQTCREPTAPAIRRHRSRGHGSPGRCHTHLIRVDPDAACRHFHLSVSCVSCVAAGCRTRFASFGEDRRGRSRPIAISAPAIQAAA
jgi:hypothetical protein